MKPWNVFAGPYLDRESQRRQDAAWFASAMADSTSRVIPVWNSRSLVSGEGALRAAFIAIGDVPRERRTPDDLILLGKADGTSFFAYDVDSIEPRPIPSGARFEDLRLVASLLPRDEAGLLAYARAMTSWRRRHRFCSTCGAPTVATRSGHALVCTSPSCRHEQFPRLDPAIIVLVSDGERALLGRQASWPKGRYSTIAGFVEPGESLEDAVAREVFEETGIRIEAIEYHSSQPWPFPSSLMLGFTARAVTRDICLHDEELEDARWFSREDIKAGVPLLPPSPSISYALIAHWFDAGNERPLRDIQPGAARPAG